jgi:hypothetical protein
VAIGTGVYEVQAQIPEAAMLGDSVPLQVQMPGAEGRPVYSNEVYISIKDSAGKE